MRDRSAHLLFRVLLLALFLQADSAVCAEGRVPSWLARPAALADAGRCPEALLLLAKIRPTGPEPERRDILEAHCLQKSGRFEEALKPIEAALKTKPSSADALFLRGVSLRHLNRPEEARRSFEEALWFGRLTVASTGAVQRELGELHLLRDDSTKALAALTSAIIVDPEDVAARTALARLHLRSGNRAEAIRRCREGLAIAPDSSPLKLALATALLSGVNRTWGQRDVREALRLSSGPFGSPELEQEAALIHIRALIEAGELPQAEARVKLALSAHPTDPALRALQRQVALEQQAVTGASPSSSSPG